MGKIRPIIISGRCSGKSTLIREKLKGGYMVVSDDSCARLYYIDNEESTITIVDEAYKELSPIKYEHLIKLDELLKK